MFLAATVIHFDTQLFNLLSGAVIPLLVGLFTTRLASGRVKAAVMVTLSIISAFVTVGLGEPEGGWPLYDYLFSVIQTIIASGVLYTNVLKPFGVTGAIQDATPTIGIGPSGSSNRYK